MRLSRWLLPSVSDWLWLLLLVMLLLQPWRTIMVASDGDACMHWRVGEWMLSNRQLVTTNQFSHTGFGLSVISKEWLAEIIFALAGRAAGLFGLAAVAALVIATTFALLHRQLVQDGNDLLAATALTILAAWAANLHWLARPHVFSFLLIMLWHAELRRFERTRAARRLMVCLPLLIVVWVNLHGAFLAGFLVLSAYWLGASLERDGQKFRALTITGLLCAGASLINPSGYQLHVHNLAFLRSDYLTGWLAEYSSANFHTLGALGFLSWLTLTFLTLALVRPKLSAGSVLVLISWTYFSLVAGRNIPLLAILTAPILAPALSECVPGWLRQVSERVGGLTRTSRAKPLVAGIAVMIVMMMPRATEMPEKNWPVAAVRFIKSHPEQFAGNMFNQYTWGGYLMWYLPEHKTFVDGRTDFFGEGLIREFADTTALRPNWQEPLRQHKVGWVLMPTGHRLHQALGELPAEWSCTYSDAVATVWGKIE